MKKQTIMLTGLFGLVMGLSGCGVVEGIFKAGMIWGITLVLLVIFGLIYLFSRGRRK